MQRPSQWLFIGSAELSMSAETATFLAYIQEVSVSIFGLDIGSSVVHAFSVHANIWTIAQSSPEFLPSTFFPSYYPSLRHYKLCSLRY
jgi:hypothetical protein